MPTSEIEKYIQSAREHKLSDEEIRHQLLSVSWSESMVNSVLKPQPPKPPSGALIPPSPYADTWIVLQHILLFLGLYVSAISLNGIFNYAVDKISPAVSTASNYYNNYNTYSTDNNYLDSTLRFFMAMLIVAFPIFAYFYFQLQKQVSENPSIKHLYVRKFFSFITSLGSAIVVIVYSIYFINTLLEGSVTLNSFAHFLVTVCIAGALFIYFFKEMKEERKPHEQGI